MRYIVDGHNLIPRIAGLSLEELDDEARLIQILARYCQTKRDRIIVFFDKAAPGHQGAYNYGAVRAFFVSERRKADDAIHDYLVAHRGEARNFIVVSSDRQVQQDARSFHAGVLSAEKFSEQLSKSPILTGQITEESDVDPLTPEEVAEWERLFTRYNK
jgi:predicted RNA-binding protein with PIN domain